MRRPLAAAAPVVVAIFAVPLAAAQPGAAPATAPAAVQVDAVPAYAPPGAVAPTPPAIPPPVATTIPPADSADTVGIQRRAAEDAAADRAYLARTAIIAPRGTVSVDIRAPTAPGAYASVNGTLFDRLEVGVGGIVIADESTLLGTHAKLQLVRGRGMALAVALDVITKTDEPEEEDTLYMPSLVASLCTDGDACRTLLSLHLTGLAFDGEDEMPVFGGVSLVTGKKNRLVAELHVNRSEDGDETVFGGYLGGRFGGSKVAFDVGVAIGGIRESDHCDGCGDEMEVVPFPFLGLSARL